MRISFVIPAYNKENYIEKCLKSLFGEIEKFPKLDFEVIVVNKPPARIEPEKLPLHFPKLRWWMKSKKD